MKKTLLTLAISLGAMSVTAFAEEPQYNLNTLSTTYNTQARYQFSENDVKAFVYQWFAGFDHQQVSGYFVNRIATPYDMQYPDFPISSQKDFLKWYQGVTDNIVWNTHHLSNIKVTGDQANGWNVSYVVNWQAKDKAGKSYDMNVSQQLRIIRIGEQLKIAKLRAEITK